MPKNIFKKMYPLGSGRNAYAPSVATITIGAAATVDLSAYSEDIIYLHMTSSSATTANVTNPQVGTMIILEQDSTGTNNHAMTFTGTTLNVAGNSVATTNADDESLILLVLTSTRLMILANNGSVALS